MAESLEKIENLRRSLMIDVAHELRTPLTNIRGYLEALHDSVLPPSTETFSLLQDETLRLVQLVEDVLQLARADAAHGRLHLEPTDLRELVNAALDNFSRAFAQNSVQVHFHTPAGPTTVAVDRARIARVLRNLTDNAARYTPPSGTVDIRIMGDTHQVRVEYINNAGELVADDLPYLFERFYRGEKSRSRQHGGAGIGLAIVKELVEAHGGAVGVALADGRIHIWFEIPADLSGASRC
jgi:signal transduction histidine kinase